MLYFFVNILIIVIMSSIITVTIKIITAIVMSRILPEKRLSPPSMPLIWWWSGSWPGSRNYIKDPLAVSLSPWRRYALSECFQLLMILLLLLHTHASVLACKHARASTPTPQLCIQIEELHVKLLQLPRWSSAEVPGLRRSWRLFITMIIASVK